MGQTKKCHNKEQRWGCSAWRREGSRETLGILPVPKGDPRGLERKFGAVHDRTRGMASTEGRVRLEIRKEFLPRSRVKSWLRLDRKTVDVCIKHFQKRRKQKKEKFSLIQKIVTFFFTIFCYK